MTPQDVSRDLFERRMRQRRAATCVAAARASLAEGRKLEATERLEEACRLDPEALEARLLLEEIRAEEPAELPGLMADEPVASTAGFGKWSHWVAAVIAVAALAALALLRQPGADESRNEPARDRARPAVETEAPAAADASPDTVLPPAHSGDTVPLLIRPAETPSVVASAEPGSPAENSGRAVGTGGRSGAQEPAGDSLPRSGDRSSRGAGAQRSTAAAAPPPAAPGPPRPDTEREAASPPATELPVARPAVAGAGGETSVEAKVATADPKGAQVASPPAAPAGPPAPAQLAAKMATPPLQPVASSNAAVPAAVDDAARRAAAPTRTPDPAPASYRAPRDEEEIGRTLQQYADAYEKLDAAAARRVWPSVDERALARAFAGLESQGISFERCETEVEGAEARAVCRGRARYVPKVGSRDPLTASRQWTFRLRRAGEGWQIASAEVR